MADAVKRRFPDHVDTADKYGYLTEPCPYQVDVTEFGHMFPKYVCGCPYDTWPVSLVKTPKLDVVKISSTFPVPHELLLDYTHGEPDHNAWDDNRHWHERARDRWTKFRYWLAWKIYPEMENYDSDW